MQKSLPLSMLFKGMLLISSLSLSLISGAAAQDYKSAGAPPPYKGESPPTPKFFYKGQTDTGGSAVVPSEGKYGGQIYTSDLYHGDLEGSGYMPTTDRSLHDGFYMGAEVGYDSYNMRNSINIVRGGVSVFQENPDLNAVGLSYSLVAGYGRCFDNPLYLGTEVFYTNTQANSTQTISIFKKTTGVYYIKNTVLSNYGISLMPGIKLTDSTLLYLKGGYTRVDIKTYESSTALGINNAHSNGANGIHYGLGIEAAIYKNWSVRGEYTHLNSQSVATGTGNQVTPTDNQVMFAVILHFI